jgi:ABC-type transport system involved in multi-copper enzyme maturation permease subunit
LNTRALTIVIGFELKRMLVGPRGVLTLLAMLVTLVPTCFWVQRLSEELVRLQQDAVGAAVLRPVYGPIAWFTDLPDTEIEVLFRDHPPHLVAFFAVCIWFVPMLSYITGFDQTATDIRSRHLRFLLLRVDRATLLLGRALAVLLILATGYALTIGLLIALMIASDGGMGGVSEVVFLVRIWLCLVLFSVPMVALLSWTNTLTGHPYLAFAAAVGLQFGVWVLGLVGQWQEVSLFESAPLLFPTAYKYNLLSDDPELLQVVLTQQLALTMAFAALAWFAFRRRDV